MKTYIILFLAALGTACNSSRTRRSLENNAEGRYHKELATLRQTIQTHFYDSASGYYKEVPAPDKNHNPYSFLWPLCAMLQAANEIEVLDKKEKMVDPMLTIIRDYYDPAPPAPGYASYIMKLKGGDRFYDDNQWIGITAMDAYARTNKQSYLNLGKEIYRYMMTGFDTVLGGGIYWQENKKISKNTCSNGPGIILALQLYQATKQKPFLDTAFMLYHWTNANLKAPSGLYFDNISVKDKRIDTRRFSYNTGTMLQSNVYLYEITKDKKYLTEAIAIADSSLTYFLGNKRFRDNYWFNAVLLRGYQHLLNHHNDLKYIKAFQLCLDNVLTNDKNPQGLMTGRRGVQDLVAHGGLLEILARYAWLENRYQLPTASSSTARIDRVAW